MRVILLGTGGSAGVPMLGGADGSGNWGECDPAEPRNRRTRASIVVESDAGKRLLVDTAPEMRTQLLDCHVPGVDAILYTHPHADHIAGIDDVRILNRIAQTAAGCVRHALNPGGAEAAVRLRVPAVSAAWVLSACAGAV